MSLYCHASYAQSDAQPPESLEPIIVTASGDPILSAIMIDAQDHRRKVVAQSCVTLEEDKDGRSQLTRSYVVDGPSAFQWTLGEMLVDGKAATDKQRQKAQKQQEKRNQKRQADDDERYAIFADLIAARDQVEKLSPQDGMARYRINRLPKKMAEDIPGSIAKHLKPIIWVADVDGNPYVRRLEITMGDFRMYVVAKINSVKMDIQFERRADGYVKEREVKFEGDFSLFGSRRFQRATVTCDAGGPIITRPEAATP